MMVVEAEGSCCRIAHGSDALGCYNAMTDFQAPLCPTKQLDTLLQPAEDIASVL